VVERLAEDHAHAQLLADGLQGLPGVTVARPQSNIVFVELAADKLAGIVERLARRGVLVTGDRRLRLVTHLDVSRDEVLAASATLNDLLR
jgi:threonine aldolase